MQKYQERKAALEKSKDGQEKEKWKSVLIMDITSSDESGYEDDKEVIISHPLPWLSANATQFKQKLDEICLKNKNAQSRRQMKERLEGLPSLRSRPIDTNLPSWVFK